MPSQFRGRKGRPFRVLGGISGGTYSAMIVFSDGRMGLYCLVAVSACMSLMFPTIYGMALEEVGDDAKIGAAGLIMAILGGSVIPPVQAAIIDAGFIGLSFLLPLLCFAVVAWYGWRCAK